RRYRRLRRRRLHRCWLQGRRKTRPRQDRLWREVGFILSRDGSRAGPREKRNDANASSHAFHERLHMHADFSQKDYAAVIERKGAATVTIYAIEYCYAK